MKSTEPRNAFEPIGNRNLKSAVPPSAGFPLASRFRVQRRETQGPTTQLLIKLAAKGLMNTFPAVLQGIIRLPFREDKPLPPRQAISVTTWFRSLRPPLILPLSYQRPGRPRKPAILIR